MVHYSLLLSLLCFIFAFSLAVSPLSPRCAYFRNPSRCVPTLPVAPLCRSPSELGSLTLRPLTYRVHSKKTTGKFSYDGHPLDDRGVPIVWKLLKLLYGEADAGRIWHRTAMKQLVQTQGFTQSEFDPCYFFKKYSDGYRFDLILYVDHCWMADTGSAQAENDVCIFRDRFKLTLQEKPK
eukprot:4358883-Pleurochrysis_carterae.AAC.1